MDDDLPHVLLTAFEPFDGTGINSSAETLADLLRRGPERWMPGLRVSAALLPVRFGDDTAAVERALSDAARLHGPVGLVLHFGQTPAGEVGVERVGLNLRRGDRFAEPLSPVEPGAPPALLSPLPCHAMAKSIREAGIPAVESAHAGSFLCNHVLYRSLLAWREGRGPPAGFVHLPRLPAQVARPAPQASASREIGAPVPVVTEGPSMPLEQLVQAAGIALWTAAAAVADGLR